MNDCSYSSKSTPEKKAALNLLIPDKNLQDILFNFSGQTASFLTNETENTIVLSSTLTVISLLIYKSYTLWKIKHNHSEQLGMYTNSMQRIATMLNGFYDAKRFNFTTIENLFINLQIDCSLSDEMESSFVSIMGMQDFFKFDRNLSKSLFHFKNSAISSRYAEENWREFNFEHLCNFLTSLPILKHLKAEFVPYKIEEDITVQKVIFHVDCGTFPYADIDMGDLILAVEDENVYYMDYLEIFDPKSFSQSHEKYQHIMLYYSGIMNQQDQVLAVVHSDTAVQKQQLIRQHDIDDNIYILQVVSDDAVERLLINMDIVTVYSVDDKSYFFSDYVFLNNGYIRNIALVISDTITENTKNRIVNEYRKRYSAIFKKFNVPSLFNLNDDGYRWDELIIFLMLEVGIFDLLIFILQGDESYDDFLRSFKKRFGEVAKKSIDSIPQVKNPTMILQKNKDNNAAKAQAKALILLATKLFSESELNMSRSYSPNSILDIMADLKRVENMSTINDADGKYKISYVLNSIIDVNKFIYIFYDGLIEYTKELKWLEFNDDVYYEHNGATCHRSNYSDTYKHCLEKFKAKTESNKKYNKNLIALDRIFKMKFINATYLHDAKKCIVDSFAILKRFNADCAKSKTERGEAFYEATGRKQVFSPKLADTHCNAILDAIDQITDPVSAGCVEALYNAVIDYFDYLRCGNSHSIDVLEDSIYPIFGTFSEGVVSRDGYRYSHINTYHSDSNMPVMIRCISEDELSFEETYYFVPNINRVAETHRTINNGLYDVEKLWIRPISIPCRTYSPAGLVEFMPLGSYSDYATTAELLYQTDETIYPCLFGSKENAKKALPIMFDNPDSIFSKNNIFIAKIDGKVCGVISYYEKIPQWNENIIKNDLRMAGLEYSDEVGSYFSDTFNDSLGTDNALICDLCVAESYRNQGVAKNLLNSIIKRAESRGKNIIISTYADNDIALRLYVKMGFVAYLTSSDSRGEADGEYKYVQLIRFV